MDLTQEAASDRVHMDASYWSRVERGVVDPGVRTVRRIATALGTTPTALLVNPQGVQNPTSAVPYERHKPTWVPALGRVLNTNLSFMPLMLASN